MKRALLVVDMINDFATQGGALYCGPSMQEAHHDALRELEKTLGAKIV